ncbi:MAG TPA: hypothetical protein VNC78_07500 [Actinomycetota bacterium]|nr:hypothetical protein [Actinomycetota bacterium]
MKFRKAWWVAIAATALLLVSAIAAPPSIAQRKGPPPCQLFEPGVDAAAGAPIAQLNDAATVSSPLIIEFEHGPGLPAVAEEKLYFNVQLYSAKAHPGIYIRLEFDNQSDVNLTLYDNAGKEVTASRALNYAPIGVGPVDGTDGDSGSFGYESITGFRAGRCDQYTLESSAFLTMGTPATLKMWLGKPVKS